MSETGLKKDTIRRRLLAAGLRSYRPVIKPPFPAVPPDLNPIENVWAVMKTELRKLPMSTDSDELFVRLVEIWNGIDALPAVLSKRRRLASTIDVDGGHKKY